MKKFITIDSSKFPIVVARCKHFTPTLAELRQAQMDIEAFAHGHTNFVVVVDLTDLGFVSSEFRIAQAKWSEQIDPLFVKQKLRLAFYTPSSIARIMLKGVFLISKPAVPHIVVNSIEQGFSWGLKQMAS
jgi:hypothetical protein